MTILRNMTYFLHETIWFELVAVGEAAHQRPLALFVHAAVSWFTLGSTQGLTVKLAGSGRYAICSRICGIRWLAIGSTTFMARASLVRLAIEQKVPQDATGTPEKAVGPALDPTLVLIEYEHRSRGDHLPFGVDQTTRYAWDETTTSSFEDQERVASGLYPA
jgi:hypothetical protein